MKSLICYISTLMLLALHIRALRLNNTHHPGSVSYVELADKVSKAATTEWKNHFDSFIDLVANKIVDNIGEEINKGDKNLNHLIVLLEDDAEIFDVEHYQNKEFSFIEDKFFSKLKEKFNNSKFGKSIKHLGMKAKEKLKELYNKHKDKLKKFFKVMLQALVIPLALKYIRQHLHTWEKKTLEATKKLDEDARAIAEPVILSVYNKVEEELGKYAEKNELSANQEKAELNELFKDKADIEKIERAEKKLLSSNI